MASSVIIPILIIFSSLLIPIAFPDSEFGHVCLSSSKTITPNYTESRALVMAGLIINTPTHDGYYYASYSYSFDKPADQDRAYELALCRGDVSPYGCMMCVNDTANAAVFTYCLDNRAAIIWHSDCFIKYSDIDFRGQIDTDPSNRLVRLSDRTASRFSFQDPATRLLFSLTDIAIKSPKFFAHGELQDSYNQLDDHGDADPGYGDNNDNELYGMVQCTRDVSAYQCYICLSRAIQDLSGCCVDHFGAATVYGSCIVRYDTYNFLGIIN